MTFSIQQCLLVEDDRVRATVSEAGHIHLVFGPAGAEARIILDDAAAARRVSAVLDRAIVEAAEAEAEAAQDRLAWQSGDDDQDQLTNAQAERAALLDDDQADEPTCPADCPTPHVPHVPHVRAEVSEA